MDPRSLPVCREGSGQSGTLPSLTDLCFPHLFRRVFDLVGTLFESIGEGGVHGLEHAQRVYLNASTGLEEYRGRHWLDEEDCTDVLMAAALHHVDDHKVFEKSVHYQNCRYILAQVDYEHARIEKVVEMISLVSFTVNGVTPIPKGPDGEDQLWKGIHVTPIGSRLWGVLALPDVLPMACTTTGPYTMRGPQGSETLTRSGPSPVTDTLVPLRAFGTRPWTTFSEASCIEG